MSDLSTDELFTGGIANEVTAAKLNNAFASLALLPGAVFDRAVITPVGGDYCLFYDVSGVVLGKATWSTIVTAVVPANPAADAAGARTMDGTALSAAPYTAISAAVTGIRKSAGAATTDVAAKPPDYALAPTAGTLVGAASPDTCSLDCSLNNHFTVNLGADGVTITFQNNIPDGDTVSVLTKQDSVGSRAILFAATQSIKWIGGSQPTPSTAANSYDLWMFRRFGSLLIAEGKLNAA